MGVGNLCGGLFTILMLIIMFSVAHRRFTELIYISQQNHANNHNVRNNRTVNTLDRHSVAINIDNNSNYSAHLWPTLTPLPLGGRRSPRSLSPRPSRTTPHDWHFPPIITVMANEESVDELQQIIDSYGDCDAIESRLPLNSDIMNGFDYQLPDLPPLYHQLDVIPTDGPPTYEEAIEEDKESTNK
ncbi:unnamed protein product [Medioppia subpectinata]|uniref:Uncharacterized protein n=1 Tax=Medioppia subpectinata TaxID=1979941 RepID=A0A7R9Q4C9_9ACAR|nr:unnamed protein product [Medioppia subpectinata]CAG2112511.1 unnamed protein product [Medioppia subpectinata]